MIISKIKNIYNTIIQHAEEQNYPYQIFGIFGLCTYPAYYILWKSLGAYGYDSLLLRSIVIMLCIPLIFINKWPKKLTGYIPIYWYMTILYSLPFLFSFLLFKNGLTNIALLDFLTIVILTILILDIKAFLVLFFLGTLLGWLAFYFTTPTELTPDMSYFNMLVYVFSIVFFGSIFAHRKERLYAEKLIGMLTLSGTVAHELRTPLRTIQNNNQGLQSLLVPLSESYDIAKAHQLDVPFISPQQFQTLDKLTQTIESETYAAFTFIDMLLLNTKAESDKQPFTTQAVKACIEQALARYPFSQDDRANISIHVSGEDFHFYGSDYLMMHLFFNLLKNALYYIHKAQKGDISIHMSPGQDYNTVLFKDTGTGIHKKDLPYVFDRFFSRTHRGTGLGLAFSKMVMENLGGKITCQSKLGAYTQFTLRFPKHSKGE